MVRHVPWDEMPCLWPSISSLSNPTISSFPRLFPLQDHYAMNRKQLQESEKKREMTEVVIPEERNVMNDLKTIGRRVAFGAVVCLFSLFICC
jgi:cobyric acid synthase